MSVDIENLSREELEELLKQIKEKLGKTRRRRVVEIPEEAKALLEEYSELKARLDEIRRELKEKYGITPRGTSIRRGYGNYDYRGSPMYNAVVEIFKERGELTREELVEALREKGYKLSLIHI